MSGDRLAGRPRRTGLRASTHAGPSGHSLIRVLTYLSWLACHTLTMSLSCLRCGPARPGFTGPGWP
jgi:hypothetical protein